MLVVKRDGRKEEFNFEKVQKVINFAITDDDMREEFNNDLELQLKNNMTTKELQNVLIKLAVEKTTAQTPEWDKIANKLYLYDVIKESNINRGLNKFGYGGFYELVKNGVDDNLYHKRLLEYTKEDFGELEKYIKEERDELLSYNGLIMLTERYCVRGHNKEVLEKPQEAFLRVAMYLALNEKDEERLDYAKKFYDVLSELKMTVATPMMSNSGKPHNQLSSCFINVAEDSLESIFNTNTIFANVSKYGGGQGLYMGKVRAKGSDIRGFKGVGGGTIPWIRINNDTAVAVNQLGLRPGAISITQDLWHLDIIDFLQLKTNNGDLRMKAYDIFPQISVPDLFMKQLKEKGEWYLFDPHEIKEVMGYSLEDSWGDEFEYKYWECVNNESLTKKKFKASEVLKHIIEAVTETGSLFWFFRDTVNRMNPNKHIGMIYCSNLCTEIAQSIIPNGELEQSIEVDENGDEYIVEKRKAGLMTVCNLSSLNLGKTHKKEDLQKVVPLAVRMMDNAIDLSFYPVQEAKVSNQKMRAIGLGTSGLHHMLALNKVRFESNEHLEFADRVFENIMYEAIKSSNELAKERGSYALFEDSDWHTGKFFEDRGLNDDKWIELKESVMKYGMRNSYVLAIAPNSASSIYGNSTQSIDPIYSPFYIEERKGSNVPVVAPDLSPETFWYYTPAHRVSMEFLIDAGAVRQKWIDQAQSLNLYIKPDEVRASDIAKAYMRAWEKGIKTIYYVRSLGNEVDDCVACEA